LELAGSLAHDASDDSGVGVVEPLVEREGGAHARLRPARERKHQRGHAERDGKLHAK